MAFARWISFLSLVSILFSTPGFAAVQPIRWTSKDHQAAELPVILNEINQTLKLQLTEADFQLIEERDLATSHFRTYLQLAAGIPISSSMIRVWSEIGKPRLIQMEAHIEDGASKLAASFVTLGLGKPLSSQQTMSLVRAAVKAHRDDQAVRDIRWRDEWQNGQVIRVAVAKAKHGRHVIRISLKSRSVVSSRYEEYPQFDLAAQVFPIYEETSEQKMQTRIPVTLHNLNDSVLWAESDPFAPLRERHYLFDKLDPIRGETPEGQAQGYWSPRLLKEQASALRAQLPHKVNSFKAGGVLLDGLYATVNLHPDVIAKFSGLQFQPHPSAQMKYTESSSIVNNEEVWEVIPRGALLGRPLMSESEALTRPARRLADHNPVEYINDGFDEIQVYYAVDRLMTSLRKMGFSDPNLSTRPFHAFLYDPDVSMKDNAYYTDDTINFTTYSPEAQNFARDNSTIWHELGHGIMDRLMGDFIRLADTGGLSEGMADFIAQLIIKDVTQNAPFDGSDKFRIINNTGFFFTNEAHDDGEAYGGSMNDFLELAVQKFGLSGVTKVADLTLEAMRLTRNHPGLTASDWFSHMLFADERGSQFRHPGELGSLLTTALAHRNFRMDGGPTAGFLLKNEQGEISAGTLGSRERPIPLQLADDAEATFGLHAQVSETDQFHFHYPVRVEVMYNGGPLQGAVHWKDEEKGSQSFTLNAATDIVDFPVTATGKCDSINREDGSCVDFVYVRIWNADDTKPMAKKRFYVRVSKPK